MDASTWAEYVNGLSNASLLAQAELFERCELLRAESLSPEGLRDALLALAPAVIERYASLAALAASEYYEANREAAIGVSEGALLAEGPDLEAIDGSVRYAARSIFDKGADEGLDEASNYLAGIVDKHVKGAARNTIAANVADDRRKGRKARYGRVPDAGACEFCRMLGSRGFVYHSKDLAGGDRWHGTEMDSYHPFCNCQVAVSYDVVLDEYWEGMVKVTRGYAGTAAVSATGRDGSRELRESDMEELFAQYQGFKDKFKLNPSKMVNRRAQQRKALRKNVRQVSALRDARDAADVWEYVDSAAPDSSDVNFRYYCAIDWAVLHGDRELVAELHAAREERLRSLKEEGNRGSGISVEIDGLVPCLRRCSDGELVQTTVTQVSERDLRGFNTRSGWRIGWSTVGTANKLFGDVEIFRLDVEGSDEPQGLVAIARPKEPGAFPHGVWAVANPKSQGDQVGNENKEYEGIGGHLFAIMCEKSMEWGFDGMVEGEAANSRLLEYYLRPIDEGGLGGTYSGGMRFFIDEVTARRLIEEYNYEWR